MIESQHNYYRIVMSVYTTHGMKFADQTIFPAPSEDSDSPQDRRVGRKLIALLALSLIIGYFTSFYSMLWTEYHYAFTKDTSAKLVNEHGALNLPRGKL